MILAMIISITPSSQLDNITDDVYDLECLEDMLM